MLKLGKRKKINISKWIKPGTKLLDISCKNITSCKPDQKIKELVGVFARKHRRLPVLDENDHVHGMLAATDVLNALCGLGKFRDKTPKERIALTVRDTMSSHVLHIDKNTELNKVLEFFKHHRRGAYPVTYRKGLVGMVTEWDVIRQIRGNTGIKVEDVMVRRPLVTQSHFTISEVAKMLCMGGFRRLSVVKKGILLGIITPRDVLSHLHVNKIHGKLHLQNDSVKNIMEKDVTTIDANQDIYEAVKIMVGKKIGGMPVIEDREVLGIVTERDIVDIIEI